LNNYGELEEVFDDASLAFQFTGDSGIQVSDLVTDVPSRFSPQQAQRFGVLSDRWDTFEEMRENELQGTGPRVTLESMSQVSLPDLGASFDARIAAQIQAKETNTAIIAEIL
jgi:hypothetical protein